MRVRERVRDKFDVRKTLKVEWSKGRKERVEEEMHMKRRFGRKGCAHPGITSSAVIFCLDASVQMNERRA